MICYWRLEEKSRPPPPPLKLPTSNHKPRFQPTFWTPAFVPIYYLHNCTPPSGSVRGFPPVWLPPFSGGFPAAPLSALRSGFYGIQPCLFAVRTFTVKARTCSF